MGDAAFGSEQGGVDEGGLRGDEDAVPRMEVPDHMDERLDALDCGKQLAAALMLGRARSSIKDAKRRTVCDQDVCVGGYLRIVLCSALGVADPESAAIKRSDRRSPKVQPAYGQSLAQENGRVIGQRTARGIGLKVKLVIAGHQNGPVAHLLLGEPFIEVFDRTHPLAEKGPVTGVDQ